MNEIKKLGIISDSHDNLPALRAAVELFNQQGVDLVIHAGDLVAPFTAREIKRLNCPYRIVLGNNDGEILGLYKVFEGQVYHPPFQLKVNDKKVLVLHDPIFLEALKQQQSFDLIIYGHDHTPAVIESSPGKFIVNPGECGGWLSGQCTIAIWDVANNQVELIALNVHP